MKKIWNKIFSSSFYKSIVILASGSILAQLINFIASPLITRIYSPKEMGDFTYVLTIITLFGTIINARYDISIVNEKEEKDSLVLVVLSFFISIVLATIVTICSIIFVWMVQPEYYIKLKMSLIWVFPLLMISGIINILNAYNNRHKEYKILTKVYVIRSLIQNILMVILGVLFPSAFILLLSQFFGQFFGIMKQSEALFRNKSKKSNINLSELLVIAKKNIKQPLYSVPATFLNAVAYSVINFIISVLFGSASLGLYSISYRVLGIPLSVFSSNIARVHLEKSRSEILTNKSFFQSTKTTFLFSLGLAIPMMIILMLLSPTLFKLVFGESWKEAGVYVQILAPMFAVRMLTGCIGYSFILANRQQIELKFQILLVVALIVSLVITQAFDLLIKGFLLVLSILFSIIYLFEIIMMFKSSKEVEYEN